MNTKFNPEDRVRIKRVYSRSVCPKCGWTIYSYVGKFCQDCGTAMETALYSPEGVVQYVRYTASTRGKDLQYTVLGDNHIHHTVSEAELEKIE